MSDTIDCPYCGEENEINHDDGFGYEENVNHEMECRHCNKVFMFTTSISYSFEPFATPCLNTEEDSHEWKLSMTFPREFSRMVCQHCEKKRQLTPEEKEKFSDWLTGKTNIHPQEE